jgi:hypothetical protein
MTDTERRELTAAELDLVGGGHTLQNTMISGYSFMAPRNGETGSAGNDTASAMFDIRQNRTA